ncbi:hypothetical protein BFL38_09590 [Brachyspira hampsonii]|uniref:Glycosyltransferase RgtA/B/C/D-like domain-containing protein n=1 Tax=Brachyspira hampsonii TaxID=1287055 RepID=A0A1E5NHT8_9SPIR|nr:hypothetical protein [Brachyspira hampsonii]OEJ15713.1 hypothetical protein BFL38_09590 [Brachyspira hampsonii]
MNSFINKNNVKIILLFLIIFSFILNIILSFRIIPIRGSVDDFQHFYDMYRWYEKGELPVTSTRFLASDTYKDEFTTSRVPGGAYYIFYILCYKLGNENLYAAKVINYFFSLLIISLFLFWLYKRLGLFVCSLISPLILLNGYMVKAMTNFWNPHISLIFGFIFLILFYEYVYNINYYNINSKISSIFIFPILAIMAQGHFVAFFSIIPTMIFYLIIYYKNTSKYIKYWILGVFLSFVQYIPYLISEIKSGFMNLKGALSIRDALIWFPFPKIQSLFLFPTNEMSAFYLKKFDNIIEFWISQPSYIYGLIFLVLNLIFSVFCLINMFYFVFNFRYKGKTDNEKAALNISKFFIFSIFITIICFFISKSKPGYFHYLYGLFSISYAPIILFLVQKENFVMNNKKIFSVFIIFLALNASAMFGSIERYINKFEKDLASDQNNSIIEFLENNKH